MTYISQSLNDSSFIPVLYRSPTVPPYVWEKFVAHLIQLLALPDGVVKSNLIASVRITC